MVARLTFLTASFRVDSRKELGGDTLCQHRDVDPPGAPEPVFGRSHRLDRESVAVRLDQLDRYEVRQSRPGQVGG